jgi:hypothetical protein
MYGGGNSCYQAEIEMNVQQQKNSRKQYYKICLIVLSHFKHTVNSWFNSKVMGLEVKYSKI